MTDQVKKMMDTLHISEAEALDLIQADKAIDRGEKLFELPDELKAAAKKARQADRKRPTHVNRERKVDADKGEMLKVCADALQAFGVTVDGTQTETELYFSYGDATYTLKLIKHRKNK